MPSIISHAGVAVAASAAFAPQGEHSHFWPLSIICSVIPDIDGIGLFFGIPYNHVFGHRGFFHSPFFGLLLSVFLVSVFFRNLETFSKQWFFYILFFFLLSSSHGILDAFTNGGLGVALLSPFDNMRYFSPWRPITVSPIGIKPFFSQWGLAVIKNEILWVWLPSFLMVVIAYIFRRLCSF